MTEAALGFSVHTGWAAAVTLVDWASTPRVVDRRRINLVERSEHDARFIYHVAAELDAPAAAAVLANAIDVARTRALQEMAQLLSDLSAAGHSISAVGLPLEESPARMPLDDILRSHSRIHAAEGKLFCEALVDAALRQGLRVVPVPSKKRLQEAARATGWRVDRVKACVARLGHALGPPWALDQKEAALAALIAGLELTRR